MDAGGTFVVCVILACSQPSLRPSDVSRCHLHHAENCPKKPVRYLPLCPVKSLRMYPCHHMWQLLSPPPVLAICCEMAASACSILSLCVIGSIKADSHRSCPHLLALPGKELFLHHTPVQILFDYMPWTGVLERALACCASLSSCDIVVCTAQLASNKANLRVTCKLPGEKITAEEADPCPSRRSRLTHPEATWRILYQLSESQVARTSRCTHSRDGTMAHHLLCHLEHCERDTGFPADSHAMSCQLSSPDGRQHGLARRPA